MHSVTPQSVVLALFVVRLRSAGATISFGLGMTLSLFLLTSFCLGEVTESSSTRSAHVNVPVGEWKPALAVGGDTFSGPTYPTRIVWTVDGKDLSAFNYRIDSNIFSTRQDNGPLPPFKGTWNAPFDHAFSYVGISAATLQGSLTITFAALDFQIPGTPPTPPEPQWKEPANYYEQGQPSVPVAGGYLAGKELAVPVVGDYGLTDFMYLQTSPHPASASPWIGNPTYVFGSERIPITHFVIPEPLPNGDNVFVVKFDGTTHTIQAGIPFDFTQFVPGGVQEFHLTGFDPSELLDRTAAAPFVHGLRFAAEGGTHLIHGALSPGNYDLLGKTDGDDYAIWRSTFGSTEDLRADGTQDGVVDAADYVVFRDFQSLGMGASLAPGTLANVPEPATLFLLISAAGFISGRFTRVQRAKL